MTVQKDTEIRDITPVKAYEYEMYCLWKSIPSLLRNPPVDRATKMKPSNRDFAIGMGIEDEAMLDLIEIRTQTQFSEKFDVDINTLTLWNNTRGVNNGLNEARSWATNLTKNVVLSLYNNAIRKGMAPEVKLWLQVVENWKEKEEVEHKYLGVATIHYDVVKAEVIPTENATSH